VKIQLDISAEMKRKIKGIISKNPDGVSLETAYEQYIEKVYNLFWRELDLTAISFSYKANSHIKYSVGEFT
jgi:hypothetical protein